MRKLSCFVIIPSNRNDKPVRLLKDDKWGLIEFPSGCKEPSAAEYDLEIDFEVVYENIIKAAVFKVNDIFKDQNLEIECIRGQDLLEAGDIISQIMRYTCTADIIIADITANNPNVFLEFGIRLAVKDNLNIMICHEMVEKPPFDVEKLRYINYAMGIKKANEAKDRIVGFIRTYIDDILLQAPESKGPAKTVLSSNNIFKQLVELHTGREYERKLLGVLGKAPKLIADLASFFFTKEKSLGLKQELFKLLDSVENVLEKDPRGQMSAIEHLEIISEIKGLSRDKLQDTFYKLWEICASDPNLEDSAHKYLEEYKKFED